jgi:hydroxymethylbilane synthase
MRTFRIGTRESPLALAQTHEVISALENHHPSLKGRFEIIPMKTMGDTIADRSLTDVGGKSLFTKEIETSLLKGTIDLAVHSMKDVSVEIPKGLAFPAMLKREDPRDALITRDGKLLNDLPPGALFGTSSLRRQAYVLRHYPHLLVTPLRGNVATRLEKVDKGIVEATLLAVAGLKRLGIIQKATKILEIDTFLPAIGQGAIGVQCRQEDQEMLDLLTPLNHFPTYHAVTAERAFMKSLNGSCRTPMAAHAFLDGDTLIFKGMLSDSQGNQMEHISLTGPVSKATWVGEAAAQKIREKMRGKCFT